jgi:hypothetical protein
MRVARLPADKSVAGDFWTLRLGEQHDRFREQSFEGIVFDYDGTLCSSRGRFDGPTADLASHLIKLLDNGITIAVATGRGRSVRKDLQRCIPRNHWEAIWIGYYNCSDISTLADEKAPDRSEHAVECKRQRKPSVPGMNSVVKWGSERRSGVRTTAPAEWADVDQLAVE